MTKGITAKTLPLVWLNLSKYVAEVYGDKEACRAFCHDLNDFLDGIAEQDGFGTEGQCDPRGDQRT